MLLIALVTLGTTLFGLLMACVIFTCARRKPRKKYSSGFTSGVSFLPQRAMSRQAPSDSRAMIQDTSSEDSRSETNTLPYVKQNKPSRASKKEVQKKTATVASLDKAIKPTNTVARKIETFNDQKDRSLTVMIPRAKYHPVMAPPPNNLMNYTTFEAGRKSSVPSVCNETKLLSYLDAGPIPSKVRRS